MLAALPHRDVPGGLVAGRYELVRCIARGGMGAVYVARDLQTSDLIALKRLLPEQRSMEPLFRAEFRSIASLKHPYIIEVFEFGVDGDLPYYTMELLDGSDLREVPQVDCRTACRYLRDIASSLALIHARRMLHRDVSPHNVRLTNSGRCKLFDFGVMVPFGVPANVAGTPPFISPEAHEGGSLDQRSDLYSLGALAYWLFSRRLPPAVEERGRGGTGRTLASLRRRDPEIPEALEELILSLMEIDSSKRPRSAADVIVRLNAIAELEHDDEIALAQSYISSSRFVGRKHELAELSAGLDRLQTEQGSAILVQGGAGLGKSRLLHEIALIAQVRGVRVLRTLAGRSLLNKLADSVLRAVPSAYDALDRETQTTIQTVFGSPYATGLADSSSDPVAIEQRAMAPSALSALLKAAADHCPLLIAIDDLESADPRAAGLIASLAKESESAPLMVVATTAAEEPLACAPTEAFATRAQLISLRELDLGAVRILVASLFGITDNVERLVGWLYRAAHGNPGFTIELASVLLERGTIRYVDGSFLLPGDIDQDVPPDIAKVLRQRLETLSQHARYLAHLLAVRRGTASLPLLLEAAELDADELLTALHELVRHRIVVSVSGDYGFAQEILRQVLSKMEREVSIEALHARLGAALLKLQSADPEQRLEAGWHLMHTSDELRGAGLVREVGPFLVESGTALHATVEASEMALRIFERSDASPERKLAIQTLLVRAGYLNDFHLIDRYSEATIVGLEEWTGLRQTEWLIPRLGEFGSIVVAYLYAWVRWLLLPLGRRGPNPGVAFRWFVRVAVSTLGVRVMALDQVGVDSMLQRMSRLRALPTRTTGRQVYLASSALAAHVQGRDAELERVLESALRGLAPDKAPTITEAGRQDLLVGLMMSRGVNACFRRGSVALEHADALEALGTPIARAASHRIRLIYHHLRGATEKAEHYRRLLDVRAIQEGATWQLEWHVVPIEGIISAEMGDWLAMRQALARLDQLVSEVPTLGFFRQILKARLADQCGEHDLAVELGEDFIRSYPPGSRVGWAYGYVGLSRTLNRRGEHGRAKAICERALGGISAGDREYAILYDLVAHELAVALFGLGEKERGVALLKECVDAANLANEPILVARSMEAEARAYHLIGELDMAEAALRSMERAASEAGAPLLMERASALQEVWRRTTQVSDAPEGDDETSDTDLVVTPIRGARNSASTQVLELVTTRACAAVGYVFVLRDGVELIASTKRGVAVAPELERVVRSMMLRAAPVGSEPPPAESYDLGDSSYELVFMRARRDSEPIVVALGRPYGNTHRAVPGAMLRRLAISLVGELRHEAQPASAS